MKGKDIFNELFIEQVEIFISSFSISSKKIFHNPSNKNKLHHPGEFGRYREKVVAKFLKLFTPQRLEIDSGFVISPEEKLSKQLDIIVYGKNETPLIKSEEGQKFFPIESIASVGEIKSDIGKDILKKELNNLARIKKMRENIPGGLRIYEYTSHFVDIKPQKNTKYITQRFPYNPKMFWSDQISTFLICNKFTDLKLDNNNVHSAINDLYGEDVEEWQKVDFILSLNDGFIGYRDKKSGEIKIHPNHPLRGEKKYELALVNGNLENYDHLRQFVNAYYHRLTFTNILKPEIGQYLMR